MTELPGMSVVNGLRLSGPVWGFDPSTLRMAAGILQPGVVKHRSVGLSTRRPDETVIVAASLKTLPAHPVLAMRQVMAVDALVGWLRELDAEHGTPVKIGLEVPMGSTVSFSSFYVIGALYVALGQVWGAGTPRVVEMNPGQWKKAATGAGRVHPHRVPRGLGKVETLAARAETRRRNRAHELARIVEWARSVGYAGGQEDEAAALGVAVAAGLAR
jgi:hypothetical protein